MEQPSSVSIGQHPCSSYGNSTWPGLPGAGNSSERGMWSSVSVSSGPIVTNCDDRQHAVQPLHGTSASRSSRNAACMSRNQAAKLPAGSSPSSVTAMSFAPGHRLVPRRRFLQGAPMATVDLQPAAQRLAELVRAIPDDRLEAPTPCEKMNLATLLDHVDGFTMAFTVAATKDADALLASTPPQADAAHLAPDWRERIPRQLDEMAQAWRDPQAWTGMT